MKTYVYSDLSVANSVRLEVEGKTYEVAQFTASWAVNEVPTAVCLLAVGRHARSGRAARIHTDNKFRQMAAARVYFNPRGEADPDHDWPRGEVPVFDGFLCGFNYRKVAGKLQVVANLVHWLAALGFSSCLTRAGHVANPTQLNAAAVLGSLKGGNPGGGGQQPQAVYVSQFVPGSVIAPNVQADLWGAVKSVFCGLAGVSAMPVTVAGACDGTGVVGRNDAALAALGRIEGPGKGAGGDCSRAYKWGVPLRLDTQGVSQVEEAVAKAIGQATVDNYAHATFWDKLVGEFCPMFGLAVVPTVDSALVVADTPTLAGRWWKEVTANDYDGFDMSSELHRPLRGVGVVSVWGSQTGGGAGRGGDVVVGGCYLEDSVRPGDGVIQYVAAPAWLNSLYYLPGGAGGTTGLKDNQAPKTATTPGGGRGEGTLGPAAGKLYSKFAHDVYVTNALRGRAGVASGRLRFDIAPGSLVKVSAATERFIGGEDDLAVTQFAAVVRVTVGINAESGAAGTTFQLSHVRSEAENAQPRTSVSEHPLFGTSIHGNGDHGCPLVDTLSFD